MKRTTFTVAFLILCVAFGAGMLRKPSTNSRSVPVSAHKLAPLAPPTIETTADFDAAAVVSETLSAATPTTADICTCLACFPTHPPQGPIQCERPCVLDYDCVQACRNAYQDTMSTAMSVAYNACKANDLACQSIISACQAQHLFTMNECANKYPTDMAALNQCLADASSTATTCYNNAYAYRDNMRTTITNNFENARKAAEVLYWACTAECCYCEDKSDQK